MKGALKSLINTITLLIVIFFSLVFSNHVIAAQGKNPLYQTKHIAYTDAGKGKVIVFIHAFPTDKQLWIPQHEELKKHFRIIALDLWGFGQSEATDGQAVTMTDYADEVKQLLDELHIKHAIIGGESMGGYIALAFLQKHSKYVSGLILSDTQSIADSDEMKAKREANAIHVLKQGTTQLIEDFMPKALSPMASEEKRLMLKNILSSQAPAAVASALRGMAVREDTSSLIANTDLPMLIITGDQDVLISPKQSAAMHALAKNSKLVIIPDAGHLSSFEQPEDWNNAVINIFSSSGVFS